MDENKTVEMIQGVLLYYDGQVVSSMIKSQQGDADGYYDFVSRADQTFQVFEALNSMRVVVNNER